MTPAKQYQRILKTWSALTLSTFRCGHFRTASNTIINRVGSYEFGRCKTCHNLNNAKYRKKKTERRKH